MEQHTVIDIETDNVRSKSIASRTSTDEVIYNINLDEDETIGLISARNIVHQQTDTGSNYIVNVVSTNNDNDNASNANANYNDTRSELSSEYGERIMMSNDSKYTSISVTIIVINTKHWRIDCIHSSYCTHNKSANYNDMCILSSIVDNSIYHLLVRYDWTRDTVVRFVVGPSTSISVCNVGTLYESEIVYDANNITANLRTDEDIDNCTYQDGEHRMSMHNTGFELALDSMTVTHNILSLDNVNTQRQCRMKEHRDNTYECSDKQLMPECKNNGIGKRMHKCRAVNTKYNSLAIKTSSWIVLITRYMHTTTLHQLEGIEHKIVCSRLDGRGVTNVEHLHTLWYASNLSELKRYL
jgi:hypothetical protein